MGTKGVLIAVLTAALLYILFVADPGVAANSDTSVSSVSVDCVTAIEQQYSPGWADLNPVQRFAIGMRAASCEGGK